MIDERKLIEELTGVEVAWYLDGNYTTYDSTTVMDIIEEQPQFGVWISCGNLLPDANKDVLITFKEYMKYSGQYIFGICKAVYIPEHFIKVDDLWSQNDCYELEVYDEDEDCFYAKEGWYEIVESWDDYTHVYIDKEVTS